MIYWVILYLTISRNFTFAFLDSWSQEMYNKYDKVQQVYWNFETTKLWNESEIQRKRFYFQDIDDFFELNEDLQVINTNFNLPKN